MRALSCARGVVLITTVLIAAANAQARLSVDRLQTSAAQTKSALSGSVLGRNIAGGANNWTIGFVGGLPESTILRSAAEIPRNLNDGDELRILPFATPWAEKPAGPQASSLRIAQRADLPLISVPSMIAGEAGSVIPLPIRIDFMNTLHKYYVRLWGMPLGVTLNAGNHIESSWVVPLSMVPNLRVNIPTDVSGRYEIVVTLFNIDGTVLANADTLLVIGSTAIVKTVRPTDVPERAAGSVTPPQMPTERPYRLVAPVQLSTEDKARAEQFVAQGEKYLADANIYVARQFFLRAADLGLAAAALRLAATYDPAELGRLQVRGVVPDPDEARKWYERARQLGASETEIQLARSLAN